MSITGLLHACPDYSFVNQFNFYSDSHFMNACQFSIIIPTYNRPSHLTQFLKACVKLDYPRDRFEIVIVNDGSPTSMESITQCFSNQLRIVLIQQCNSGPAVARNTGAALADGMFLVFMDDDCMPAPDYLTMLDVEFKKFDQLIIGGKTLNALPQNLYSTASQLLIDYLYQYYNINQEKASFFTSNNFTLSAAQFSTIGGFDPNFPLAGGEDREFCDRWLCTGHEMRYVPELQMHHGHDLTLSKFWRQHFNYGRGAFYFNQIRSQRRNQKLKVEPWQFYFNLLIYGWTVSSEHSVVLLSFLLWLSQVANVSGFFWAMIRSHSNNKTSKSHPFSLILLFSVVI